MTNAKFTNFDHFSQNNEIIHGTQFHRSKKISPDRFQSVILLKIVGRKVEFDAKVHVLGVDQTVWFYEDSTEKACKSANTTTSSHEARICVRRRKHIFPGRNPILPAAHTKCLDVALL